MRLGLEVIRQLFESAAHVSQSRLDGYFPGLGVVVEGDRSRCCGCGFTALSLRC